MYSLGAEPGERSRLHVLWEQNRGSAASYMYFGSRTGGAQPVTTFTLGAESGASAGRSRFYIYFPGSRIGERVRNAKLSATF